VRQWSKAGENRSDRGEAARCSAIQQKIHGIKQKKALPKQDSLKSSKIHLSLPGVFSSLQATRYCGC
jgi:hypothetical protein